MDIDQYNKSLCYDHQIRLSIWLGVASNLVSKQCLFIMACLAKGLASGNIILSEAKKSPRLLSAFVKLFIREQVAVYGLPPMPINKGLFIEFLICLRSWFSQLLFYSVLFVSWAKGFYSPELIFLMCAELIIIEVVLSIDNGRYLSSCAFFVIFQIFV